METFCSMQSIELSFFRLGLSGPPIGTGPPLQLPAPPRLFFGGSAPTSQKPVSEWLFMGLVRREEPRLPAHAGNCRSDLCPYMYIPTYFTYLKYLHKYVCPWSRVIGNIYFAARPCAMGWMPAAFHELLTCRYSLFPPYSHPSPASLSRH